MALKTYTHPKYGFQLVYISVPKDTAPDDGVLYREFTVSGRKVLYKLATPENGIYNALWWGVVPGVLASDYSAFDCQPQLQKIVDIIPEGSSLGLFCYGQDAYTIKNSLVFNRRVGMVGDLTTLIRTPGHAAGIVVKHSAKGATYKNFTLRGHDKDLTDKQHGIMVEGVVRLENIEARNMQGNGLFFYGNVGEKSDCSQALVINCKAYENKGSGALMLGPDANHINFDNFSASDNAGYGWEDASFLGCNLFNPMFHDNAKGHRKVHSAVASSNAFGNYQESGSPPSEQGQYCSVFGGTGGPGTIGGSVTTGVHNGGSSKHGSITIEQDLFRFDQSTFQQVEHYNHAFILGNPVLGFAGPGSHINSHEDAYLRRTKGNDTLEITGNAAYADFVIIGGRLEGGASSLDLLDHAPLNKWNFLPNSYLKNKTWENKPGQPTGWRCYAEGVGNKSKWKAEGV